MLQINIKRISGEYQNYNSTHHEVNKVYQSNINDSKYFNTSQHNTHKKNSAEQTPNTGLHPPTQNVSKKNSTEVHQHNLSPVHATLHKQHSFEHSEPNRHHNPHHISTISHATGHHDSQKVHKKKKKQESLYTLHAPKNKLFTNSKDDIYKILNNELDELAKSPNRFTFKSRCLMAIENIMKRIRTVNERLFPRFRIVLFNVFSEGVNKRYKNDIKISSMCLWNTKVGDHYITIDRQYEEGFICIILFALYKE